MPKNRESRQGKMKTLGKTVRGNNMAVVLLKKVFNYVGFVSAIYDL